MFSAILSDNGAGGLSMNEVELAKNAPEVSRRSLLLRQTLPYIAVLTQPIAHLNIMSIGMAVHISKALSV
jgi:hypothetical protein